MCARKHFFPLFIYTVLLLSVFCLVPRQCYSQGWGRNQHLLAGRNLFRPDKDSQEQEKDNDRHPLVQSRATKLDDISQAFRGKVDCPKCLGVGQHELALGPVIISGIKLKCPECSGTGKTPIQPEDNGTGEIESPLYTPLLAGIVILCVIIIIIIIIIKTVTRQYFSTADELNVQQHNM